ncbi:MAG TPA: hypothetical protein VMU74_10440 [Gaiellaceae bacterium]|nr:hypothetical protein [Gaiellaceae bacterium]
MNRSSPGQSGMNGAPLYPVATMTVSACIGPAVVSRFQPRSMRSTRTPVRTSMPCASTYSAK